MNYEGIVKIKECRARVYSCSCCGDFFIILNANDVDLRSEESQDLDDYGPTHCPYCGEID